MERSKRCSNCYTVLPLDREHFYWDSHKGSFCSSCKICKREFAKKAYHKRKAPKPVVLEDRLLQSNYMALERLLRDFYTHGKASAPIQLNDSPEPLKEGIQLFESCGEGIVRFTTITGVQTRRLPLTSVNTLAHTLSSFDMRILNHDE